MFYKSPLFMQNKPNFHKVENAISSFETSKYEKFFLLAKFQNKANQTQIILNQLFSFVLSLQSAKMARKLTS